MARIIIAGVSQAAREQLSRLLASSGFDVFRLCASEGDLRRALNECEDGIVLISGQAAGIRPDDIVSDFGDSFRLLLIGRPETLSACESPHVFRLTYPCPGSAVIGAVEMLAQMHSMHLPKRSGVDRTIVEEAKRLLMREYGIDEPEAHRRMQRYAMRHGISMVDYASQLLHGGSDNV